MIPQSITKVGYLPLMQSVRPSKFRRLMIGIDGGPGTGKTEFGLSAPGTIMGVFNDPGIDNVTNNPTPPATRCPDVAVKFIPPPIYNADPKTKMTPVQQNEFIEYWRAYREEMYVAAAHPDSRTVLSDSDSDSWQIQKLAEYGKVLQVMPNQYATANNSRKAYYLRLFNSSKIIICTNKIKRTYETKLDANGVAEKDGVGADKREWTGEYERQGFADQDYLFHIQLTALYKPGHYNEVLKKELPQQWGIRINLCKANRGLEGEELWGSDCTFAGLVGTVYPHIDAKEWGL